MDKFYTINDDWVATDRRKLQAFARDLTHSDCAGRRVTFELFAQAPPLAPLAAACRNIDWGGPLDFVKKTAELGDRVKPEQSRPLADGAVTQSLRGPGSVEACG